MPFAIESTLNLLHRVSTLIKIFHKVFTEMGTIYSSYLKSNALTPLPTIHLTKASVAEAQAVFPPTDWVESAV